MEPKKSADIIEKGLSLFIKELGKVQTLNQKLTELKEKVNDTKFKSLVDPEELTTTLASMVERLDTTKKLFYTNVGKMVYEGPASEVFGEFKIWKEKAEDVEQIQNVLIDLGTVIKSTILLIDEILQMVPKTTEGEV